ncbi:MAG TPA: DUF1987 domain-containing protein [Bacteroidia bacterium]|jgi:SiaC family regulatory phosphoprotein|nr:DUF1987 domain-containing protein [Bacteroidia bacterium]
MIAKLRLFIQHDYKGDSFTINSTRNTPSIVFKPQDGLLEIRGSSFPEDAGSFYAPLIDAISKNSHNISYPLTVNISLESFNGPSSKYLFYIFRLLEIVHLLGSKVVINWYYAEDNDIYVAGIEYKNVTKIPFNLKHKNNKINYKDCI